jgi:hypothetical protein
MDAANRHPAPLLYLLINGVLAISAFLPWQTLAFFSASGVDIGVGWVVVLGALAAGGVAVWAISQGGPLPWWVRGAQFASAGAGAGMALLNIAAVASACSQDELFCVQPDLGIGCVLALLAGIALGVVAMAVKPKAAR